MPDTKIRLILNNTLGTEPNKLHDSGAWCRANLRHVKKIRNKDDLENICIYQTKEEDEDKIEKKDDVHNYIKGDKLCTFEGMIIGLLIRGYLAAKKKNTSAVTRIIKLLKKVIRHERNYGKTTDDLRKKPKYLTHVDTWDEIQNDIENDPDLALSKLSQVDQAQIAIKGRVGDVIKEEFSNIFKGKRKTKDDGVQAAPEEIERPKSHSKRRMTSEEEKDANSGSENFNFDMDMNGDGNQNNNEPSDESSLGDEST